jgi:hypothetical protein
MPEISQIPGIVTISEISVWIIGGLSDIPPLMIMAIVQ